MMPKANAKIGKFMIAIGAIIEQKETNKILLLKRANSEVNDKLWEIMYGRVDQHEELEEALKREIWEETGIHNISVKKVLRIWHIYRGGEKRADMELYGLTFYCQTDQTEVKLSREHSAYKWLSPQSSLDLINVQGIREDILTLMNAKQNNLGIYYTDINCLSRKY